MIFFAMTSLADKIIVLEKPAESLQARVELLAHAKKIDVQYFTVEHDYISISGLALLRAAARRGAQVRIIVDSMHNLMTRELMSAVLDSLDSTTQKNIQIKEFNNFNIFRPFCYTRRMHDKSLIIDGKYLIVGDRNVANGYYQIPGIENKQSLPTYAGTDAVIEGTKSVQEAEMYFNKRWDSSDVKAVNLYDFSASQLDYSYCSSGEGDFFSCENKRLESVRKIKSEMDLLDRHYADVSAKNEKTISERPLLKAFETAYETDDITFIHDDPSHSVCKGKNPEYNIGKTLYDTIKDHTKKDLYIVTPYLVVTREMEQLVRYLVETKDVSVRFITNSTHANDVPSAQSGYLKTRDRLLNIKNAQSGQHVKIYEYYNISNAFLTGADQKIINSTKTLDTLHAKIVLMDNTKAYIGSYNWDYRSQNLNSEVGIVVGLQGTKKSDPTEDIRSRISEFLATSKLVNVETHVTNSEDKVQQDLSVVESNQITSEIAARHSSKNFWSNLLSLPIVGELLLNQQ